MHCLGRLGVIRYSALRFEQILYVHHDSRNTGAMMATMRTTIPLEPDVEALIRTVMKERGISFKEALNSSVRAGLTQTRHRKRHFVQKSFSLGSERNFRWDKALATADAIDGEELSRKLSLSGTLLNRRRLRAVSRAALA